MATVKFLSQLIPPYFRFIQGVGQFPGIVAVTGHPVETLGFLVEFVGIAGKRDINLRAADIQEGITLNFCSKSQPLMES